MPYSATSSQMIFWIAMMSCWVSSFGARVDASAAIKIIESRRDNKVASIFQTESFRQEGPLVTTTHYTDNISVTSVVNADPEIKRFLNLQAYMSSLPCIKKTFVAKCDLVVIKIPTKLQSMLSDTLRPDGTVQVTPELMWQWRMYDEMKELLSPHDVHAMRGGDVPGQFSWHPRTDAWLGLGSVSDVVIHNMYENMVHAFMRSNCYKGSLTSGPDAIMEFDLIVDRCTKEAYNAVVSQLDMHIGDLKASECASSGEQCAGTSDAHELGSFCMEGMQCANLRTTRKVVKLSLWSLYAAFWFFTPYAATHLPPALAAVWAMIPAGPITGALVFAIGSYASGCGCAMMECEWDSDSQLCALAGKTPISSMKTEPLWARYTYPWLGLKCQPDRNIDAEVSPTLLNLWGMIKPGEPKCALQPCELDDLLNERIGRHEHGVYNCKNWGTTTKQARFQYYSEHPVRN